MIHHDGTQVTGSYPSSSSSSSSLVGKGEEPKPNYLGDDDDDDDDDDDKCPPAPLCVGGQPQLILLCKCNFPKLGLQIQSILFFFFFFFILVSLNHFDLP